MNDQRLNKALKITLILLLLSLVTIILLYLNITGDFQKRVECGELRPTSGEGAWVMQLLVFAYVVISWCLFAYCLPCSSTKPQVVSIPDKPHLSSLSFFRYFQPFWSCFGCVKLLLIPSKSLHV